MIETKLGMLCILIFIYNEILIDWNLDEKLFSDCNFVTLKCPICFYKERQVMLGFTFSVGDTTQVVYN